MHLIGFIEEKVVLISFLLTLDLLRFLLVLLRSLFLLNSVKVKAILMKFDFVVEKVVQILAVIDFFAL